MVFVSLGTMSLATVVSKVARSNSRSYCNWREKGRFSFGANYSSNGFYAITTNMPPTACDASRPSVRLEDGKRLDAAEPNAVEINPKEALRAMKIEPFAVSGSDHCQLMTRSEDLQV